MFGIIYICVYIYIHTYKHTYIHTYIHICAIIRLPHPWSRDSQGQETLLAPSADNQIHNYDKRVLRPPSLPIKTKVKGIEP